MKALAILVVCALAGEARAELWMSRLGELMKDAQSIEVIDVDAMDANTGAAEGKVFETWRSKHAVGERVTQRLGVLAGLVKTGDRVMVVCDSECPRAVGVERDGWYTLTAQEPMDGAFVVPSVVSHLSLPALVNGGPVPSLCVKGSIALLDGGSVAIDGLASATTGAGGAAIGQPAVRDKRPVPLTIGVAGFGMRAYDGLELELAGFVAVRATDPKAHADCKPTAFAIRQPGPRSRGELTAALAGKGGPNVFARGTYRGKPLELAIQGQDIVLVGDGSASQTTAGVGTLTYTYKAMSIGWAVNGSTPVEVLAKAKSVVVTVDGTAVTLRYVPAK